MKIKSFRELRSCLRCDACRYVGLEGGGEILPSLRQTFHL